MSQLTNEERLELLYHRYTVEEYQEFFLRYFDMTFGDFLALSKDELSDIWTKCTGLLADLYEVDKHGSLMADSMLDIIPTLDALKPRFQVDLQNYNTNYNNNEDWRSEIDTLMEYMHDETCVIQIELDCADGESKYQNRDIIPMKGRTGSFLTMDVDRLEFYYVGLQPIDAYDEEVEALEKERIAQQKNEEYHYIVNLQVQFRDIVYQAFRDDKAEGIVFEPFKQNIILSKSALGEIIEAYEKKVGTVGNEPKWTVEQPIVFYKKSGEIYYISKMDDDVLDYNAHGNMVKCSLDDGSTYHGLLDARVGDGGHMGRYVCDAVRIGQWERLLPNRTFPHGGVEAYEIVWKAIDIDDIKKLEVIMCTNPRDGATCSNDFDYFFQEWASLSDNEYDEDDAVANYQVACDVSVFKGDEPILHLGIGMDSVVRFHSLAEAGIDGAISYDFQFYCNVDVMIRGDSLIKFIEKEYHRYLEEAKSKIDPNEEYRIVCYDMS